MKYKAEVLTTKYRIMKGNKPVGDPLDYKGLMAYAVSIGYSGGGGPFFIGQWLSFKGLYLYEKTGGKTYRVGWTG